MNKLLKFFFIIGFVLTLPIILLSLIAVWYEDGFPLIFVQKRLGQSKKEFNLYKIRTMYKSTPNLGTHEIDKIHHLKFGVFIRKLKIDELPQIINYIIGDIHLIGPRPGLVNQEKLKYYREKFHVYNSKPGITGLAQVLGYDMSSPELLAMIDDLYIKQKTTKLDITIFFATFFTIFRTKLNHKYGDNIQEFKDQLNYV
jgi:lipopolysaccharide/colanic/teichoic acid biosynthesis glycosyltransferase